jgi:hypothetical protein
MNTSHPSTNIYLAPVRALPLIVAALMSLLSLAGLNFQSVFYPTQELQRAFVSNDVVNLFIGLPILLISFSLARRGKMIGSLLLPGALLYVTYNYIAYSVAAWPGVPSVFYMALVGLSLFGVYQCVSKMDQQGIQQKLRGAVPERFAGGVLMAFGLLFFFRGIGQAYSAFSNSSSLVTPEMSVVYADLLITPLWILGGLMLWRRQALGYAAGAGLLFQASMLFVGLLVFFILQPFLTGAEFPTADFAVIFAMGLIFFIPLGMFARGVLSFK